MKNFNHLIAKHGVLISFNIAKKINRKKIKSIVDEINKMGGDEKTRQQLIQEEIRRNTLDSMKLTEVPGLIMSKNEILKEKNAEESFMLDESKVISLIVIANNLAKKMLDKKLPKEQICFILISIINSLGLTDLDFKNFHKKHNSIMDEDDGDLNESDEEYYDEDNEDNEDDEDGIF